MSILKRNLLIEYTKAITECAMIISIIFCILPNFKADAENGNNSHILLTMFKYTINNYLKFLPRNSLCREPGNVFKVIVRMYVVPTNFFFESSPKRSYIARERGVGKENLWIIRFPKIFRKVVIEWLAVCVVAPLWWKNLFFFSSLKQKWRANLSTASFWIYCTQK